MTEVLTRHAGNAVMVGYPALPSRYLGVVTSAAAGIVNRFGQGAAPAGLLTDVNRLAGPFRAPQAASSEYTKAHSNINAHWTDRTSAVDESALLYDRASHTRAAYVVGALWGAYWVARGPGPESSAHRVFPGALDADWLGGLPLPTVESWTSGQDVSLASAEEFDRFSSPGEVRAQYAARPRTHVFESVHAHVPWVALAARWLGALSGSELSVLCTVYDSRAGDEHLDPHWDAWLGLAIQLEGRKAWRVGGGLLSGDRADVHRFVLNPGDVMVLPDGLAHAVTTPADPGHSRHLLIGVRRRELGADEPRAGLGACADCGCGGYSPSTSTSGGGCGCGHSGLRHANLST